MLLMQVELNAEDLERLVASAKSDLAQAEGGAAEDDESDGWESASDEDESAAGSSGGGSAKMAVDSAKGKAVRLTCYPVAGGSFPRDMALLISWKHTISFPFLLLF
jgi:uncharacterized protein YfaP (DUF2135 family)